MNAKNYWAGAGLFLVGQTILIITHNPICVVPMIIGLGVVILELIE